MSVADFRDSVAVSPWWYGCFPVRVWLKVRADVALLPEFTGMCTLAFSC